MRRILIFIAGFISGVLALLGYSLMLAADDEDDP